MRVVDSSQRPASSSTRRAFIGRTAGVVGAALWAGPRSLRPARASDDALAITLRSAPIEFEPSHGAVYHMKAFNGSLPGPVIRVRAGSRVRILYRNDSGAAGTIHWHGLILPNDMDGVEGITQSLVPDGGSFVYEFTAANAGTRWYHDHVSHGQINGLFGMFVIDDPRDEPADLDVPLVFHDVPVESTIAPAMQGRSNAPMTDPAGSQELAGMAEDDKMGDEVAYQRRCINGKSYPETPTLVAHVGARVRLRILNANPTQTRYVRLTGSTLRVTHADGNALGVPVDVDVLRIGVGERYDAWFVPARPGAWMLQSIIADPLSFEQALIVRTDDGQIPESSTQSLAGLNVLSYESLASGVRSAPTARPPERVFRFTIGGGQYGSSRWTLNGAVWPNTEKVRVRRNDRVLLKFRNTTDMDHPLHLHGHTFFVESVDGKRLRNPLAKDTALIRANGGTLDLSFVADSPAGRWLMHCHNLIHMMDGMMTEVVYEK